MTMNSPIYVQMLQQLMVFMKNERLRKLRKNCITNVLFFLPVLKKNSFGNFLIVQNMLQIILPESCLIYFSVATPPL
jgi:hypothetical protein